MFAVVATSACARESAALLSRMAAEPGANVTLLTVCIDREPPI